MSSSSFDSTDIDHQDMFKQLFEEPPPGAVANLLSPRRKVIYGVLAFAPGTLLGLYLFSVKLEMDAENKRLQDQYIADQTKDTIAQEQKDLLLTNMINDLRERIKQLEDEARRDANAHNSNRTTRPAIAPTAAAIIDREAAKATKTEEEEPPSTEASKPQLPAFLAEYEATLRPWLQRLDAMKTHVKEARDQVHKLLGTREEEDRDEEQEKRPAPAVTNSGIRERIVLREREAKDQDVRAFLDAHRQQPKP